MVAAEAREEKLPIAEQDDELEDLILRLYEDFAEEMELGSPFNPLEYLGQQLAQPVTKVTKVVVIESLERSDHWERELLIIPPGQMQIRRNHWRR
uniref:Uncharacterized protein n=1 Tax=mine drainage metagenome TaxID=410659 RepID=E6PZH5_9ZZZZ